MLNFYSGHSKAVNPKKAVKEALESAIKDNLSDVTLIILNITSGYNNTQILEAIKELAPNAQIIGTTSCGVVSNGFVNESMRALSLVAITGDEFSITKIDDLDAQNSYDLATQCAKDLKAKDEELNMIMAFAPGARCNGEAIIEGFTEILGDEIPILGGLGGFTGNDADKMFVFYNQEILLNSIVVVAFHDKTLSVAQASHHGYLSDNHTYTITKADGTFIVELDNKPAWNLITDLYNLPFETTPLEALSVFAIGMELDATTSKEYDNDYTLTAPLVIREDGAMLIQTNIKVGNSITVCVRDEDYLMNGVEGLNKRVTQQYNEKQPVAVFQTDCVARGRISNGITQKDEIIKNMQDGIIGDAHTPWLGMYALGEFAKLDGKNHYHNYTTTISTLLR
jgi:hypothetical protein